MCRLAFCSFNSRVIVPPSHPPPPKSRNTSDVIVAACVNQMDLKGQQYAEWLMHLLLIAFGIIGWIVGFLMQSFQVTVMIVAAGVVVLCILIVPDWPMFNRNPIKWRTPKPLAE